MDKILSVSEITGLIKSTLEEKFSEIDVIGEISNFKAHISGHWYFTLKDANAQINCTMWRGLNSYVFFTPQDGIKVLIKGRITVYPPRGNYQLDVRSMKPAGVGELQAAFEKMKEKLAAAGIFDDQYKKSIPSFPSKIGIVTAIDGAAFKDMISVAKRRYPLVEIVIASSKVQGEGAAKSIADSICRLNKQKDIDVIIVGRGGGSLEDLWAFNEEMVAMAIFNSKIPIVSGIGHEIDFTIADFVADLRAATPTAAMELATPNKDEIFAFISDFSYNSNDKILDIINNSKQKVFQIINSYGFRIPQDLIQSKSQLLDNLHYRIQSNIKNYLILKQNQFAVLDKILVLHDVSKILQKGFAIVKQDDNYVERAAKLIPDKSIKLKFYDNEVKIN